MHAVRRVRKGERHFFHRTQFSLIFPTHPIINKVTFFWEPPMKSSLPMVIRRFFERLFTPPSGANVRFYKVMMLGGCMALLSHSGFIAVFAFLGVRELAMFNILSVASWAVAIFLSLRNKLIGAFAIGVIELMAHAAMAVRCVGWVAGFHQYMIPLMVIAWVAPRRIKLSVACSVAAILFYAGLYHFDATHRDPALVNDPTMNLLYIGNTILSFGIVVSIVAYYVVLLDRAEAELQIAHQKSETLLTNILPGAIADRLKRTNETIAEGFTEASILFADIEGFTPFSQRVTPVEVVHLLNNVFLRFDSLVEQYRLEKIKTIGDAYMVAAGIPVKRSDHAEALADFALAMRLAFAEYNREHNANLRLRIGINSGPVVAGVIGRLRFLYDLWGDAVNTASRMESQGVPDEIQITEATRSLLGEKFICEARGVIEVKGKGSMQTYLLKRRA
jgi:class 3 adenylate cyclase